MDQIKREKLEEYLSQVTDIPTLPHIVIKLFNKIHEPEPDVEELADLIMSDQVLTTRMIRMVNSAFWGLNREVNSVREAIVFLGLREITNLIYSVSLANTFEHDTPLLKRVRFWEHSLGCALISKEIAIRAHFQDRELAYLAGLVHDIGEVIIAVHFSKEFEKVVEMVLDKHTTFYSAEDVVLGINHTDFGAWLVRDWKLPSILSDVVSFHHNPLEVPDHKILVAIVRLADLICLYHQLDFGYSEGENIMPDIVNLWHFLSTQSKYIADIELSEFLDEVNKNIEDVKSTVDSLYGQGETVT